MKDFKFECTTNRLGVRIWAEVKDFRKLYKLVSDSYPLLDGMTPAEQSSYLGVITAFAYDLRHTYMGSRLVSGEGKTDDDDPDDESRIVGVEFSWVDAFFYMAAWKECLMHHSCPSGVLPLMRKIQKGMESVLKKASKTYASELLPYLHGAIYAANPYLIQSMEYVILKSFDSSYSTKATLKELSSVMPCTSYGTEAYKRQMDFLKSEAERLNLPIEELSYDTGDAINDLEL